MKTFLRRVRDTYLSVSATTSGRVTTHVDRCPHCHERTTWAARVVTGYARCLQCGRNPLASPTPGAEGQAQTEAPAAVRARAST
jgi:ribosomal protein S27E